MTVKYGRFCTLVFFGQRDEKKVEKFHPENRIDFRISYLTVKRAQKKQNNSQKCVTERLKSLTDVLYVVMFCVIVLYMLCKCMCYVLPVLPRVRRSDSAGLSCPE